MSSPARSSVSAASGGATAGGSIAGTGISPEEAVSFYFIPETVLALERKETCFSVLRSEVMEDLDKEVKSLEEDNWKFTHPRSKPNLFYKSPGTTGSLIHAHAMKHARNF